MTFVNVPYTGDDKILSDSQLRTNSFSPGFRFYAGYDDVSASGVSLNYVESRYGSWRN